MAYDVDLNAVFFTSLDDYFDVKPFDHVNVRKLEPYSVVEVTLNKEFRTLSLHPSPRRRALVIASGGLDSTVAATKMIRKVIRLHSFTLTTITRQRKRKGKQSGR